MQLQKLVLTNFRQHTHKEITFPPGGVIVISGPNGCGKSSVVHALYYVLTGVTQTGVKAQNLRWGADTGSVSLDFLVNNQKYTIVRSLHTSKVTLTSPDGSVTSKAEQVKQAITQLLSLDVKPSALDKLVFSFQGQLSNSITRTNAEQLKLFHELLGTDRYEHTYEQLGLKLSSIVIPESVFTLDEIDAQIVQIQKNLDAGNKKVDSFKSYELSVATINEVQSGLFEQAKAKNAIEQIKQLESQLQSAQNQQRIAGDTEIKLSLDLMAIQSKLKDLTPIKDKAQADLAAYNSIAGIESIRDRLNSSALALEAEGQSHHEPPRFEFKREWAEQERRELAGLRESIRRDQEIIDKFGSGQCPTCGTTRVVTVAGDIKALDLDVSERRRHVDAATALCRAREEVLARYAADAASAERAINEHQQWLNRWIREVQSVQDSLASLPPKQPIPDKTQIDEVLAEFNKLTTDEQRFRNEHTVAVGKYNAATTSVNQLQRSIDDLRKLAEIFDADKHSALQARLAELNNAQFELGHAIAYVGEQAKALKDVIDRRNRVAALQQEITNIKQFRGKLEKLRQVFHRNQLPLAIIKTKFAQLTNHWNKLLQEFDMPFSAHIQQDGQLMFGFSGQFALPSQLSGGQLCCASLSFLLALKELFARDIGFLVLDEPTYGLDSDRLARVADVLTATNQLAVTANLQVIVVTHEDKLKVGFATIDC